MTPYQNLSGDSGVAAYEVGDDFLKVRFWESPGVYVYTSRSAGAKHLREMKRLAAIGRGLSTYISRHVHDRYDRLE
jgi:hypothetical protein